MKRFLKSLGVVIALGATLLIVGIGVQMVALNRQAMRLVRQSDGVGLGWTKAEVIAAMPKDLLVSTNPPTAEESADAKHAVSALRYNAPVLLNSVYVLLLFDANNQLIAKKRFD
ncbi:MAG: hypothetical protein PHR77_16100 [Kiritimatiellae bacterium]|nr:hypothetical protein [Kiritimatiellia bacterium]MDD5523413.1 hypothetical protein [Kiritimatiellia bacterium]